MAREHASSCIDVVTHRDENSLIRPCQSFLVVETLHPSFPLQRFALTENAQATAQGLLALVLPLIQADTNGRNERQVNIGSNGDEVLENRKTLARALSKQYRRMKRTGQGRKTHRLLIPKHLPDIEKLPLNLRHRPASQSDSRGAIEPIALQIQLHIRSIARILEMHTTLRTANRKMTLDFKAVPRRRLAHETLVQGDHLLLDSEEVGSLHVCEGFGAVEREDFAFAFADWLAGGCRYGEVVAGEGEDFLFHLERRFCGRIKGRVGWLRAERRVEGGDGGHVDWCDLMFW